MAPRGEILDQATATLQAWNPALVMGRDICVEKGDKTADRLSELLVSNQVITNRQLQRVMATAESQDGQQQNGGHRQRPDPWSPHMQDAVRHDPHRKPAQTSPAVAG